jgi:hypothetical protein
MPDCVDCDIKIFADDTKAYSVVDDSNESKQRIQSCINQLISWADTWLLKCNNQKCKVMHLGKKKKQKKNMSILWVTQCWKLTLRRGIWG